MLSALGLDVTDDRLDCRPSFYLAFDRSSSASDLANDPDPQVAWIIVAAIAVVELDAPN